MVSLPVLLLRPPFGKLFSIINHCARSFFTKCIHTQCDVSLTSTMQAILLTLPLSTEDTLSLIIFDICIKQQLRIIVLLIEYNGTAYHLSKTSSLRNVKVLINKEMKAGVCTHRRTNARNDSLNIHIVLLNTGRWCQLKQNTQNSFAKS